MLTRLRDTADELNAMDKNLSGVRMPNFGGIGQALSKQIPEEPEPESEEDRKLRSRSFGPQADRQTFLQVKTDFLDRKSVV